MVSPGSFGNVGSEVLKVLPQDIASEILLIIQAIGGLIVIYLIFLGLRIYWQRRQLRKIEEIGEDIKLIKSKLKI